MLAGHITLEDLTIQYKVNQNGQSVNVTICDAMTGYECTYETPAEGFMLALGAAISFSGEYDPKYEELIEAAMPPKVEDKPNLRFVP